MGWLDKPTDSQINALRHMIYWKISDSEAADALAWLKENANRKQVSEELSRVRDLYIKHSLDRNKCFAGEVWQEYFNSKVGKE